MPARTKNARGFTLIELMIVIAILGILLAIAIPSYQYYSVRARMAEGVAALMAAKQAVAEHRLSEGSFPTSASRAGFGAPDTQYVDNITIDDGILATPVLIVEFDETETQAPGDIDIVLVPTFSGNAVRWECGYLGAQSQYSQYLPSSCRNQVD